eukprot:5111948-Amphidinium_carterae.2
MGTRVIKPVRDPVRHHWFEEVMTVQTHSRDSSYRYQYEARKNYVQVLKAVVNLICKRTLLSRVMLLDQSHATPSGSHLAAPLSC